MGHQDGAKLLHQEIFLKSCQVAVLIDSRGLVMVYLFTPVWWLGVHPSSHFKSPSRAVDISSLNTFNITFTFLYQVSTLSNSLSLFHIFHTPDLAFSIKVGFMETRRFWSKKQMIDVIASEVTINLKNLWKCSCRRIMALWRLTQVLPENHVNSQ